MLVSIILIAAGTASCFFGGKLTAYLYIIIYALLLFLLFAVALSNFGTFSILETDSETTSMGVFKAIVGFVVCAVASIGVGVFFYKEKFKDANLVIIGSIAGSFLGFLLYSLFASIITRSLILLCLILIACSAFFIFLMFIKDNDLEALAFISIGAYLIIRGLSFFLGGYPNEVEVLFQLSDGN